jgi:hypothetical protein
MYPLASPHRGHDGASHKSGWRRTNRRYNLLEWSNISDSLSSFPTESYPETSIDHMLRLHFSHGSMIDYIISIVEIHVSHRNISVSCGHAWLRCHDRFNVILCLREAQFRTKWPSSNWRINRDTWCNQRSHYCHLGRTAIILYQRHKQAGPYLQINNSQATNASP